MIPCHSKSGGEWVPYLTHESLRNYRGEFTCLQHKKRGKTGVFNGFLLDSKLIVIIVYINILHLPRHPYRCGYCPVWEVNNG